MRHILPRGLIVSCQACEGEPLYNSGVMHLMARCAKEGGATAIRALAGDIKVIREEVKLPIIGLIKKTYLDSPVFITPTKKEAAALIAEQCEVIAIDATDRLRPDGQTLEEIVEFIRSNAPDIALMADISTIKEAENAERLGFDYISTTLRGYTEKTKGILLPDYDFIKLCSSSLTSSKFVVEGGIWDTTQLSLILNNDPYAVVIGTAITRPKDITARFAKLFPINKG